jgi:hypothetical protein
MVLTVKHCFLEINALALIIKSCHFLFILIKNKLKFFYLEQKIASQQKEKNLLNDLLCFS